MNEEVTRGFSERVRVMLGTYLSYGAVALVSLAYVAASFLTVEASGKGLFEILADGAAAFLLGITVNRMLEVQGIRNGERDARVLSVEEKHESLVERVSPDLDALDGFCEARNREALERARRTYLSRHGLRYGDHFDSEGIRRPWEHAGKRGLIAAFRALSVRRHVRTAAHLRLTRLSAGLLISDAGNPADPYFLGRSKREYERECRRGEIASKLMTALLFGYYGVELLQSFSVADLIWTVLQVGLFLLMGGIRMEKGYLYVVDEYRARIQKKCDVLRAFLSQNAKEEERREEKGEGI